MIGEDEPCAAHGEVAVDWQQQHEDEDVYGLEHRGRRAPLPPSARRRGWPRARLHPSAVGMARAAAPAGGTPLPLTGLPRALARRRIRLARRVGVGRVKRRLAGPADGGCEESFADTIAVWEEADRQRMRRGAREPFAYLVAWARSAEYFPGKDSHDAWNPPPAAVRAVVDEDADA